MVVAAAVLLGQTEMAQMAVTVELPVLAAAVGRKVVQRVQTVQPHTAVKAGMVRAVQVVVLAQYPPA